MSVFKTYRDAVIANGSTKGVYTNLNKDEFHTCYAWRGLTLHHCNPADYLESVADFQARGKLLVSGDIAVTVGGDVIHLPEKVLSVWNSPSGSHNKRFILQAAADNEDTETPEEREVLEAMSESVNATTWRPVVGDHVSTAVGVGRVLATVVRDNTVSYIVQFENDWNEFTFDELKSFDHEYEAGKRLRELWINCYSGEVVSLSFELLDDEHRNAWIELAKRVKVLDNKE